MSHADKNSYNRHKPAKRAAAQMKGGPGHQWLCLFPPRQGNERLGSQISCTKQLGMFTKEIRWWFSLSVPSVPYGVMHYDNSEDESHFNASVNFFRSLMHKNPFCGAATDAVSCLLVCYLILKTHVALSELDNKSLYTLRHVHRMWSFLLYPLSFYHRLWLEVNGSRVCKDKMWEVYWLYWTLYKLGNLILKCGITLQETRYVTTATDHHLHSLTGQRTSYEHRPDKNTQGQSSPQRRDSIDN